MLLEPTFFLSLVFPLILTGQKDPSDETWSRNQVQSLLVRITGTFASFFCSKKGEKGFTSCWLFFYALVNCLLISPSILQLGEIVLYEFTLKFRAYFIFLGFETVKLLLFWILEPVFEWCFLLCMESRTSHASKTWLFYTKPPQLRIYTSHTRLWRLMMNLCLPVSESLETGVKILPVRCLRNQSN